MCPQVEVSTYQTQGNGKRDAGKVYATAKANAGILHCVKDDDLLSASRMTTFYSPDVIRRATVPGGGGGVGFSVGVGSGEGGGGDDAEDVGRLDVGAEGYIVAAVVPLVVSAGEEVFDLKVLVVGEGQFFEVEVDPAGLLLGGVEVDGYEDAIVAVGFAVAEDVGIVGGVEVEGFIALEGRVFAADAVDLCDERGDGVGGSAVPVADLVLFRC